MLVKIYEAIHHIRKAHKYKKISVIKIYEAVHHIQKAHKYKNISVKNQQ
jgi:hypothetical protein